MSKAKITIKTETNLWCVHNDLSRQMCWCIMHLFNYKLNVRVTFFLSQAYFLWQDLNFCRLSNTGFSLRLNTGYGPRMTSIIQGIKCNVCLLFCQTNFFLSLFFLVLRYLFSDVLAGIQSTMHCFPLCVFLRYLCFWSLGQLVNNFKTKCFVVLPKFMFSEFL